ncbi:MAG: hypothetical protein HYY92_01535 [Parcubacteria group bacterium]|nr:hypothetical protein [Parcubacteria group bacterium]
MSKNFPCWGSSGYSCQTPHLFCYQSHRAALAPPFDKLGAPLGLFRLCGAKQKCCFAIIERFYAITAGKIGTGFFENIVVSLLIFKKKTALKRFQTPNKTGHRLPPFLFLVYLEFHTVLLLYAYTKTSQAVRGGTDIDSICFFAYKKYWRFLQGQVDCGRHHL